ncbi:MAG: hypothetical protein HPY72_03420 [Anaerolineae bacterium]|nr:hypothetical protein [Anaerolineae bacterium]
MNNEEFTKIHYPAVRVFTADTGRISMEKHYVRSLLEVDVTDALQKLKQMRVPGRKTSFLAWFIKVTADTVAQHPPINGIRKGRNSIWVPRSVDVSTVAEKVIDNMPVPLPLVLREANRKSPVQLNDEIQAAVAQPVEHEGNYVLGSGANRLLLKLGAAIPQGLRLFIMRKFILNHPKRVNDMMGSVMVTSLGTFGQISGWIIPTSMHPLSIGIGTINKKEALIAGKIEKRSILHLTLAFDHDVIDGMPALKFVDDLVSALERGAGI